MKYHIKSTDYKFRTYSFERLDVWKLAMEYLDYIYDLTKKFPPEEKFNLTGQLNRAASSVPTNLAEGTSRITGKEQARFSEISFSSLMESLHHLLVARMRLYITEEELIRGRLFVDELANKINNLRKSQLKKKTR